MDFKSRFEGKKSFINKRGDIEDPTSKAVVTLRKPIQQPQQTQPEATTNPAQSQPYIKFLN